MRRREFITLLAGAAVVWPLAAKGQSTRKVWRLGWLTEAANTGTVFFDALRELGYTEDQNLAVERRFANAKFERLPALATELVALKLDLIHKARRH